MKIVCIAADVTPEKLGGAETHVIEVIKRLAPHHQIYLFVGKSTAIKKILPESVVVFPVSYPHIPNLYGLSFILFGYPQIINAIKKIAPDVIWAKQSFPQAILSALVKNTVHAPLYITAQNPYLVTEELVVKGRLLTPFMSLFAWGLNSLIKWSYRHADTVAAVSKYSETAAQLFGAKNTVIIPNGYDPAIMKPVSNKKPNNVFTIVTTSSLIPRNGIDTLIKAVQMLPAGKPWQLLIAGDGPELKHLQNLLRCEPAAGRKLIGGGFDIKFLGRVPNKDIPELVKGADLFVRPSRKEGFGVSFIEAMACGVPIIGTPVGGIPDFLIHNKTGLSVPVDDPESLAHAIQKLMNDAVLRETLTENAREYVSARYTWDRVANQVEKSFTALVNKKILIITPIYPPEIGGPASYVPEVASRLTRIGHNVTVISFSKTMANQNPISYFLSLISIKGNALSRQYRLLRAIKDRIAPIDTLYIQGTIVVGLTALLGRLYNKRVVIKFVGDEVWESSHSSLSLEQYYESNPQSLMLFIHRLILRSAHRIVVPSAYLKDFLVRFHSLNANKIIVIPNSVEIPFSSSDVENNKLIFVGRLVPHKHVDEIIEAVAIASKQHPWTLTIVGDGPEKARLTSDVNRLNAENTSDVVTFLGQLPKSETLEHIAQSKALILYSSYEGHPHTVLEAHALGIATIVSDISPHKDLGSFKLVEPHNPTALAAAINALFSDKIPTPPKPPTWSDHMEKLTKVLAL